MLFSSTLGSPFQHQTTAAWTNYSYFNLPLQSSMSLRLSPPDFVVAVPETDTEGSQEESSDGGSSDIEQVGIAFPASQQCGQVIRTSSSDNSDNSRSSSPVLFVPKRRKTQHRMKPYARKHKQGSDTQTFAECHVEYLQRSISQCSVEVKDYVSVLQTRCQKSRNINFLERCSKSFGTIGSLLSKLMTYEKCT